MDPLFLTPLIPLEAPETRTVGQRVRWPGDDREWVWSGEEWIPLRVTFDGGDAWDSLEETWDQQDAA